MKLSQKPRDKSWYFTMGQKNGAGFMWIL
jgi:hypothetical protein